MKSPRRKPAPKSVWCYTDINGDPFDVSKHKLTRGFNGPSVLYLRADTIPSPSTEIARLEARVVKAAMNGDEDHAPIRAMECEDIAKYPLEYSKLDRACAALFLASRAASRKGKVKK